MKLYLILREHTSNEVCCILRRLPHLTFAKKNIQIFYHKMNVNTGILPYLFKTYRARDSYHWLTTYLSAMLPNTTAPVNTPNMYAV